MNRAHPALIGLALLLLCGASFAAQKASTEEQQNLLVLNARLIDRDGDADDTTVHLLVRKGRLQLITRDDIPASEADRAFDAGAGFLMGQLTLGEPATFVVFSDDPRTNVEVLLDSAAYIRFAIVEGEIVSNELAPAVEVAEEEESRGWLAYTTPPIALPLSYQDGRKWNLFETKPISGVFAGAVVLDRQRWRSQDDESLQQVGDLKSFDGGEIRGLRFGFVGTLNFKRPWVYTLFAATKAFDKGFETTEDDDFTFFDYRLDIPLFDHTTVSIGKQKEPFSMDRLAGGAYLPMQERAAMSDALLPSRNFGIVFNGVAAGERFSWAVGGFDDWIDSSKSFGEGSQQLVGRFTGLAFVTEDESNLLHLGIGARHTDAKEGLRYLSEPEFNLSPDFVDTGVERLAADSSITYGLEASWRRGPFWFAAEHLRNEVAAPALADPVFNGTYLSASWVLSGEMRPYNRRSAVFGGIPVARSVYEGGWGSWELALRWSDLDLTEGTVEGGEMQILSAGVNWWLTRFFTVNVNYRSIELNRLGLTGRSDGALGRLVLLLE
jgi:phosphate-selective porin OprO/OprP